MMKNRHFLLIGIASIIASYLLPSAPLAALAGGFGAGLITMVILDCAR
jgi:hypothetical protein